MFEIKMVHLQIKRSRACTLSSYSQLSWWEQNTQPLMNYSLSVLDIFPINMTLEEKWKPDFAGHRIKTQKKSHTSKVQSQTQPITTASLGLFVLLHAWYEFA